MLDHYEHTHGGLTYAEGEKDREYRKERVVKRDENSPDLRGSRRADFSYKFDDAQEDLNIVDTLADNLTPTKRERDAFEGLVANKKNYDEQGSTRMFGKSKGMSWEEYAQTADHFLDILVEELQKRILGR